MTPAAGKGLFDKAVAISALSLVASFLGLLSQSVIARVFGAGSEIDAYFTILAIPTAISGAAPIVLAGVVIPSLKNEGVSGNNPAVYAGKVFTAVVFIGGLLAVVGSMSSPFVVHRMLPHLDAGQSETVVLAAGLLWAMAGLSMVTAFLSALHNSAHRFMLVVLSSLFPGLCIPLSVLLFAGHIGILAMPAGLLAASGLQLSILLPFVIARSLVTWRGVGNWMCGTQHLVARSTVVYLSLLPFTVSPLISYFWASRLGTGAVSYLGYSQSFAGFLSVAVGYGLATVTFPRIADVMASSDRGELSRVLQGNLRFIFLAGTIIATFLALQIQFVLRVVLQGGAFLAKDVDNAVAVARWYIVASVFIGCMNLLRNAYYAAMNNRGLAVQSVLVTALYFLLAGLLSKVAGTGGIGAAFAIMWLLLLSMALLCFRWRGETIMEGRKLAWFAARVVLLCCASATIAWLASLVALPYGQFPLANFLLSGVVYMLFLFILNRIFVKVTELDILIQRFFQGRFSACSPQQF